MPIVNQLIQEDLDYILDTQAEVFERLRNHRIMVTGATGLLGHMLVLTLLNANRKRDLNITVLAVGRNESKLAQIYQSFAGRSDLNFLVQDLTESYAEDLQIDNIFHAAAVTSSKMLIERPVEAYRAQTIGMMNLLSLARKQHARMVYLSSMEIYGQPFSTGRVSEAQVGYVDPLIIRNGYPESKRSNEFMAAAAYSEYGVETVNARLAQTFGPGVSMDDTRVFAQFARSAIHHEDIVLHTDGTSMGNYCYLRDTVAALLFLCDRGKSGESYNIVNEDNTVTIKQLAELVASQFGHSRVVVEIPAHDMGYAPKVQLRLSGQKLAKLGYTSSVTLSTMFKRMIASWQLEKGD